MSFGDNLSLQPSRQLQFKVTKTLSGLVPPRAGYRIIADLNPSHELLLFSVSLCGLLSVPLCG